MHTKCSICSTYECNRIFSLEASHASESEIENDSDGEDGAYGGAAFGDTFDDDEFSAPAANVRRIKPKKNWISPRLCSALDKAKVKRRWLKK